MEKEGEAMQGDACGMGLKGEEKEERPDCPYAEQVSFSGEPDVLSNENNYISLRPIFYPFFENRNHIKCRHKYSIKTNILAH